MHITSLLKKEIRELTPAYLALVMATGVISVAAHSLQYQTISNLLFWLNHFLYGLLVLLLLFRLLFFFRSFASDLATYGKGAGFFTVVAGSALLGTQHVQLRQAYSPAIFLLYVALAIWILLIYAYFVIITVKDKKESLEKGMNGEWLLMVVATQSIAILGTLLQKKLALSPETVLFTTLAFFLLGTMFYVILITLIFYRLTFYPTKPDELTAPFWINMGALAITTLAGYTLNQHLPGSTFQNFLPFLQGITLLAWATASWWIPVILLLEGWRYFFKKSSPSYKPKAWSMVFCLGMYTASTFKIAQWLKISWLKDIPPVFFWVALAVWLISFLFMIVHSLWQFTHKNSGAPLQ